MKELQIVTVLFLMLMMVSALPIIDLKYNSDLYEYIDNFNIYCYNNDEDRLARLPEKDKYIWNMMVYLYNFKNVANINRRSEPDMVIYQDYIKYTVALFLLLLVFVIIYIIVSTVANYITKDYYSIYLTFFMIIYFLLFVIMFSLILKKITEIYNDTDVYFYAKFMKNVDIILSSIDNILKIDDKDVKDVSKEKLQFLKSLRDSSYDSQSHENVYNIKNIVFSKDVLHNLVGTYSIKKDDKTNTDIKIEYSNQDNTTKDELKHQNIDNYSSLYHHKKHKERIKEKVDTVVSYLYAYLFFILILLFMLFKTFDDYFVYVYTIMFLMIGVISYYVYAVLRS